MTTNNPPTTTHPRDDQRIRVIVCGLLLCGFLFCIIIAFPDLGTATESASAQTAVPASYYGTVSINGDPAPAGTTIQAVIDGDTRGEITVTTPGEYGGPAGNDAKLRVSGSEDENGAEVVFYITADGLDRGAARETVTWESGEVQQVNLSVSLSKRGESTPAPTTTSTERTATPTATSTPEPTPTSTPDDTPSPTPEATSEPTATPETGTTPASGTETATPRQTSTASPTAGTSPTPTDEESSSSTATVAETQSDAPTTTVTSAGDSDADGDGFHLIVAIVSIALVPVLARGSHKK